MKPSVLIALASSILGGPGKGLRQFLGSGGLEGCRPLLVAYNNRPDLGDTEYITAMRDTGAPVAVLRQRHPFDASIVDQSLELIHAHGISLLQSHGYKSHVLCWLLRRRTGLPWIAYVHGWTRENLRVRVYTALEHLLLLRADVVVAVSGSIRQRLLPPVRRRCRVIPNAVALDELGDPDSRDIRQELDIPGDALVAGVVGRLSPEKGQEVFLRALALARAQEPRLFGLLVGGGQEEAALRRTARALGLDGACRFTGHVRGLAPYYRCMDMQVMPSFTEGMPNAALEGMSMGLPLIASNVGGIPEVVDDRKTGLLVRAGDAESLAGALTRLSARAEERDALGRAGRARVREDFDPHVRARRMLEVYAQVLAGRGIAS